MTIKIYNWHDGVAELGPLWSDLVREQGLNPTLHPQWLDVTLDSHGLAGQACVALVTSNGEQAIVPLLRRQVSIAGVPIRCLDLCSNVISYHAALIATGGHESLIGELLTGRDLPAWDALRFGNLVCADPTAAAAERIGAAAANVLSYPGEQSPYVSIEPDWTKYLAARPKKLRANITRCIRMTQQAGETGMTWYEQDADPERLLADILEVESRSWKAGENKAIRTDSAEGSYYRRLLPWLSRNGMLANVLYVNHKPAAYVLCAKWHGWVGQLKTSFAQDIRDAGFRVIHASLERVFRDQAREYDFLGAAAAHKLRWTDRVRAHEDKWLFARHWRGHALLRLKRLVDGWKRARRPETAAVVEDAS